MFKIHPRIAGRSTLLSSEFPLERSLPLMLRPDPGRNPRLRRHPRLRLSTASLDWALALPALLIALFATLGVSRSAEDHTPTIGGSSPLLRPRPASASVPDTPPPYEPPSRLAAPSKELPLGGAEPPGSLDRLTLVALIRAEAPVSNSRSEAPPSPLASEARTGGRKEVVQARPDPPQPQRRAPEFKAFVGTWATSPNGCPKRAKGEEFIPIVIGAQGAKAGDTACQFSDKAPEGEGWKVRAHCSAPGERWTARVQLSLAGNRLNWASERGKQSYVRCT
jgi:hypothetical protein